MMMMKKIVEDHNDDGKASKWPFFTISQIDSKWPKMTFSAKNVHCNVVPIDLN